MAEFKDKVKDIITGLQGTVTARCEYMNGCLCYLVEWADTEGTHHEHWVDLQRLEILERSGEKRTPGSRRGGPMSRPPSPGGPK